VSVEEEKETEAKWIDEDIVEQVKFNHKGSQNVHIFAHEIARRTVSVSIPTRCWLFSQMR